MRICNTNFPQILKIINIGIFHNINFYLTAKIFTNHSHHCLIL